jgi:uncharacterized hydrophobic protein (TIGR00271 family)
VPHTRAYLTDTDLREEKTNKAVEVTEKQIQLEAAEEVHKYRRESMGFTGPEPTTLAKPKPEQLDTTVKEDTNIKKDEMKEVTYADLVQNALSDMYQKRKISVPIWCHDTSASIRNKNQSVSGLALANHDMEEDMEVNATPSSQYSMVTFTSEFPELVKFRLAELIGLGSKVGSLNMIPVTISKRAEAEDFSETSGEGSNGGSINGGVPHKEKARNAFFASIQSRLVVEQVVQTVRGAATFSFDYLCLVIVAALLAAVGLASNNTVVIVASMLVSPIMGPILAITFGAMIGKKSLVWQGIVNEIASLFICVLVGFISGGIGIGLSAHDEWSWPTNEMAGRGTTVGIITGILIATPSGVGVALSILSDNTSSLVGVAISASLLPPAVNAGMMWAYAIYVDAGLGIDRKAWQLEKGGLGIAMDINATILPEGVIVQTPSGIAWAGLISLLLTLLNIAIIIVIACAMFWCKSVVKYNGEPSTWQYTFEKFQAAKYIVRNNKEGRELAKRAKWVAKFATGLEKQSRLDQVRAAGCCGCGGGSGVKATNTITNGHGVQMTTNGRTKPTITTHDSPGGKVHGGHNHNDMTPHLGARPVANTLFDGPSNKQENLALPEPMIISNAVTLGHRTLERMMTQHKLESSSAGTGSLRTRSNANMSHSPRSHLRRQSLQNRQQTLNVGKSLFPGRRRVHNTEAEALQRAAQQVALMKHRGHARKLTHSQYLETVTAMETLHGATGHTGLTPSHSTAAVNELFSSEVKR